MFSISGITQCLVLEHDSQVHMMLCVETGTEFIWSPAEEGTYEQACQDHIDAHLKVRENLRNAIWEMNYHRSWCHLIYQNCPQCERINANVDAARAAAQGVSY